MPETAAESTGNARVDVIVVGAGPNGLSCGAYLAKAGFNGIKRNLISA